MPTAKEDQWSRLFVDTDSFLFSVCRFSSVTSLHKLLRTSNSLLDLSLETFVASFEVKSNSTICDLRNMKLQLEVSAADCSDREFLVYFDFF